MQTDVPRELITPAQLFQQRLYGESGDKAYLRENYVDTRVCVVPNPDTDEIKFTHGHTVMDALNEKTKLVQRKIPVSAEQYHAIDGLVLVASEVAEFRNNVYALPTKREEVWEFFAEGNTELTTQYKNDVCASLELGFDSVMGLYLPTNKGMRLLCVDSVDSYYRSVVSGNYSLGNIVGRLVGVAPEALVSLQLREAQQKTSGTLPPLDTLVASLGRVFHLLVRMNCEEY